MASLSARLTFIMEQAFEALELPVEHARVSVSGQVEQAQYQCNGAMPCAKVARKNPREIAQDIIDQVKKRDDYESVFLELSIGGPGFINIKLQDTFIADALSALSEDCLLYTSPSPRDQRGSRMPSSA